MTKEEKDKIINDLLNVLNSFEPNEYEGYYEPDMFWLISNYNKEHENPYLIGGDWVIENCPEPLKSLPH